MAAVTSAAAAANAHGLLTRIIRWDSGRSGPAAESGSVLRGRDASSDASNRIVCDGEVSGLAGDSTTLAINR